MESHKLNVLHVQCEIDNVIHIAHADAELILCQSGSDVSVSMCTHIRIYTECYTGNLSLSLRQLVYNFKFGHRFHVEAEYIII